MVYNMKLKWTKQKLIKEALKYSFRGEFQKNSFGAYKAAKRLSLLDKICKHMTPLRTNWTQESLQNEANKYKTRSEFQKNNKNAYQVALRLKKLNKICSHMTPMRNHWNFTKIKKEAFKYKTRNEFHKKSPNAYATALRLNLMNRICKHMKYKHKNWSVDSIIKISSKYFNRGEFQRKNSNAYQAARRFGILNSVCEHMKDSRNTSSYEKKLFNEIKRVFPDAKKLIDRKVKIPNKPHIKGFHIDIYIPHLNKGIEFDGKYWHSVEGLERSRRNWSRFDLKNYHKIKDDYFRSKNIDILHIKEEDWIEDSEIELKKCMEFLK